MGDLTLLKINMELFASPEEKKVINSCEKPAFKKCAPYGLIAGVAAFAMGNVVTKKSAPVALLTIGSGIVGYSLAWLHIWQTDYSEKLLTELPNSNMSKTLRVRRGIPGAAYPGLGYGNEEG